MRDEYYSLYGPVNFLSLECQFRMTFGIPDITETWFLAAFTKKNHIPRIGILLLHNHFEIPTLGILCWDGMDPVLNSELLPEMAAPLFLGLLSSIKPKYYDWNATRL